MNNNVVNILLTILCVVFLLFPEIKLQIVFVTWILLMVYSLTSIEKRLTLFAFYLALFTFLLTRLIIPLFYSNEYTQTALFYTMTFSDGAYEFISNSIMTVLVASYLGFIYVKQEIFDGIGFNPSDRYVQRIKNITKKLVYFTSFFCLYNILEKIYHVGTNGYTELYLTYKSSLPSIFIKFTNMYTLVFYIFLATLPSKKEAKWPFIIYLLLGSLSLLTGQRGEFVLNCILLVIYFFLRNMLNPNDLWIGKRGKLMLLISVPALCALMFIVMLIRGGKSASDYDLASLFIDFFFQQGSSMQVVGLVYDAQNVIPQYKFYSFGEIIDNYYNNFIFHMLGIAKAYKSQTVEFAVEGHSLANFLTYTFQPERFLDGGGMGSSFIAEVWNDFGYIGLFVWSYMYGVILSKFYVWAHRNMWMLGLSFFMVVGIVYSPRASAISFISDILSPTNLLVIFLIHKYGKKLS